MTKSDNPIDFSKLTHQEDGIKKHFSAKKRGEIYCIDGMTTKKNLQACGPLRIILVKLAAKRLCNATHITNIKSYNCKMLETVKKQNKKRMPKMQQNVTQHNVQCRNNRVHKQSKKKNKKYSNNALETVELVSRDVRTFKSRSKLRCSRTCRVSSSRIRIFSLLSTLNMSTGNMLIH